IPLPQYFAWDWVTSLTRDVRRLGAAGLIGLSLLAGLAFAECTRGLRSWRRTRSALASGVLAAGVAAWMYAGYAQGRWVPGGEPALPATYPSQAVPNAASPLMKALSQPGGAVLELPAATTGEHARAMYASIFHGRKVVNGYSSYWPHDFPERM